MMMMMMVMMVIFKSIILFNENRAYHSNLIINIQYQYNIQVYHSVQWEPSISLWSDSGEYKIVLDSDWDEFGGHERWTFLILYNYKFGGHERWTFLILYNKTKNNDLFSGGIALCQPSHRNKASTEELVPCSSTCRVEQRLFLPKWNSIVDDTKV